MNNQNNTFTDERARLWLIDLLKTEDCTVTFTKVDGSVREMNCTLRAEVLGEDTRKDTESKPKTETLAVWDLQAKAWRSFRLDSIKSVSFDLGSKKDNNHADA